MDVSHNIHAVANSPTTKRGPFIPRKEHVVDKTEKKLKVLHVDDDLDILSVARMSLEIIGGFEVKQYENGADALRGAESFIPDAFLLDVMMPNMTGDELYRQFMQIPKLRSIPVVFMTARGQPHQIKELLELGASKVIVKPFDPMELPGEILAVLTNANAA